MKHILILLFLSFGIQSYSQITPTNNAESKSIKVYITCGYCFEDFIKTQVTWAYFVQDQFVADVNVRINALQTGSGGFQYQFIFQGLKSLSQLQDTITFDVSSIQTDNEIREDVLHHLEMGLVRYALYLDKHDVLKVNSNDTLDHKEMGQGTNPEEDPFNAWVFNLSGQGYGSGQEITQSYNWGARASASQVKETHKVKLSVNYNESINRYKYLGTDLTYKLGSIYCNALYTKSINDHWSIGTFNNYVQSDFDNYKNAWSTSLAMEYNLFPYKESQTKQLTFSTYLGGDYNIYKQTTLYLKEREFRPVGRMNVQGEFNQDWGSFSVGLSHLALLDDWKKNNTSLNVFVDARVYKGLSLSLYGYVSLIRNQINLPLNEASIDEVLLQQQVLATNYSYYSSLSLNYRFGSIYNNVVNTRFQNEF
jgi:hypothetical protein